MWWCEGSALGSWFPPTQNRSPVLSLAYAKYTQSLSSDLPGSSLQLLLMSTASPPKHPVTSFHIHIYTMKKKLEKKKKQHFRSFSHMQEDERDAGRSKESLKCTFVFLFFPPRLPLLFFQQLRHGSRADISCCSCFLWVVKGPEDDQIYIPPLISISTSTLH